MNPWEELIPIPTSGNFLNIHVCEARCWSLIGDTEINKT